MRKLIKTFDYGVVPNSYDILKVIALVTMMIDHAGYYLLPDNTWLRVIGRIAFPIFLFLVGYSRSFRFDKWLLAGALVVLASHMLNGIPVFPLNILFTILLCRAMMGWLEKRPHLTNDTLMLWVVMLVFYIPSMLLVEYGSLGMIFAMLGYYQRQEREAFSVRMAWLFCVGFWVYMQAVLFGFSAPQVMILMIETMCLALALSRFSMQDYPLPAHHATPSPTWQEKLVILASRNTLLLYVVHVVIMQSIAHVAFPELFGEPLLLYR